jgi:hypothetical protein
MPLSLNSDIDDLLNDDEGVTAPEPKTEKSPTVKVEVEDVVVEETSVVEALPEEAESDVEAASHARALLEGARQLPEGKFDETEPDEVDQTILLHFIEDGFSAFATVWYRGQELEVVKGSRSYEATLDRNGESWLDLVDNDYEQAKRFGKVMFRKGPWFGEPSSDPEYLARELKRNRKPPIT